MKLKPWYWLVLAVCAAVTASVLYRDYQVAEGQKAYAHLGCPNCHTSGGGPSLAAAFSASRFAMAARRTAGFTRCSATRTGNRVTSPNPASARIFSIPR